MKATIEISEVSDIKKYFSSDVKFLDVMVSPDQVLIMGKRLGIYCHMVFEIVTRENIDGIIYFRIDRKLFLNFISDGFVTFSHEPNSDVLIEFKSNGGLKFSITRPLQLSNTVEINEMLKLLSERHKFVPLELSSLSPYIRLLRNFGPITVVREGRLIITEPSIELYADINCSNISVPTAMLKYTLEHAQVTYGYGNYIIGFNNNKAFVIDSIVYDQSSDFDYAERLKPHYEIECDISGIVALANRLSDSKVYAAEDINTTLVKVNFDRKAATIANPKVDLKAETIFTITDIVNNTAKPKTTVDGEIDFSAYEGVGSLSTPSTPIIEIPMRVITEIFINMDKKLKIQIKKSFIIFKTSGGINVIIGRGGRSGARS